MGRPSDRAGGVPSYSAFHPQASKVCMTPRNAGTLCYLLCTFATGGREPRARERRIQAPGVEVVAPCLLTIMLWTSLPPVPTLGVQAPMSACTG